MLWRLVILWWLLSFQSLSWAQTAETSNLKVGFVNIRELMAQAPQRQQIRQKLASEFEKENQSIIALREQIAKLGTQYDDNLSKAALIQLQRDIADKQQDLETQQKQLQDEYNVRRNEALGQLQTLIVRMVAKVSKEKKLDMVLNNTGVIYVSSRIDITPDVLKYLSERTID